MKTKARVIILAAVLIGGVQVSARPWLQAGLDIVGERDNELSGISSLSADGTRLAIGAPCGSGLVRIFEYSEEGWVKLGEDIADELADAGSGTSVSLSADGTRVAIGAPDYRTEYGSPGYVRIFEYSGESWVQLGEDIVGEVAYDHSGGAVSLSADGSRVAVGAVQNDGNGSFAGHVRIFEYSEGIWVQLGADLDGEAREDFFGQSVSLNTDGTRVAVGAHGNDGSGGSGADLGHVRIFEYSEGSWVQLGADIDGTYRTSGYSVSLSANGTRVAIGAAADYTGTGYARIFEYSEGSWEPLGEGISGMNVSLSADGSRVATGSPFYDGNGHSDGLARIFEYSEGGWIQLGEDIVGEGNDRSGNSVSLSADGMRVAIGAPLYYGRTGLVRVFYDMAIVDISTIGNGVITPSSGLYPPGINLLFTATPDTGWLFMEWSGDLTGDYTTAVTNLIVDSDKSITAAFSDDADGDGILNTNETVLGTNPRESDTDHDGLSDPEELYTYDTNPLSPHTDTDGIPDGQEILVYGTNPKSNDTDMDGFDDFFEISTGFDPTLDTSTPELHSTIQTAIEFRFYAASNMSYRIEATDTLSNSWEIVEAVITNEGPVVKRLYSIEDQPKRFFRAKKNE